MLCIGDRKPGGAGVFRLPDPAIVSAHISDRRLPGHSRYRINLSRDEGADVAPLHTLKESGADLRLCRARYGQRCSGDRSQRASQRVRARSYDP